jgi:hypothetical protein
MPDWQLSNARLTAFVTPETVVPATLWRDMLGEEPETSSLQRATATRIETGSLGEGTLKLQIQPMRVDWLHEPLITQQGGAPTFGRFPASVEPFLDFVRRWAATDSFPATSRLALGFTLLSATPDRATGYRELSELIDGVPTPDATDFQYQVNRPRPSRTGIEGLQINRLSRWSVAAQGILAVHIGVGRPHPILTPLQYHLHLDLDINTNADFQEIIPQDRVPDLINDLFAGASEVSERGSRS